MSRRRTSWVGVRRCEKVSTSNRDLRYLADMALLTGAFIGRYSPNGGGNDCPGGRGFSINFDRASYAKGGISREIDVEAIEVKIFGTENHRRCWFGRL